MKKTELCDICKFRKDEFSGLYQCNVELCTARVDEEHSTPSNPIYQECYRQDISGGCEFFEAGVQECRDILSAQRNSLCDAIDATEFLLEEAPVFF